VTHYDMRHTNITCRPTPRRRLSAYALSRFGLDVGPQAYAEGRGCAHKGPVVAVSIRRVSTHLRRRQSAPRSYAEDSRRRRLPRGRSALRRGLLAIGASQNSSIGITFAGAKVARHARFLLHSYACVGIYGVLICVCIYGVLI
jgi:hypothetical protein